MPDPAGLPVAVPANGYAGLSTDPASGATSVVPVDVPSSAAVGTLDPRVTRAMLENAVNLFSGILSTLPPAG